MRISPLAPLVLVATTLLHSSSEAFVVKPNKINSIQSARSSPSSCLYSGLDTEKDLRKEIEKRNSVLTDKNEEEYAVREGEGMDALLTGDDEAAEAEEADKSTTTATTSTAKDDKTSLEMKIKRMTQPRAYPLFIAEKTIEFVEGYVNKLTKKSNKGAEDSLNGSSQKTKERIVVLGTGWGAASFLKDIDTSLYDVTIISPRNYFLFTPMLAGASVGTVEYRSITEPIREVNRNANYLEGTAMRIDTKSKTVECESVVCDGNSCDIEDFTVEYDRLVVTVGAQTNTFGIPGVREYCCFLKQVEDAVRIRTAIVNCFERANIPKMTKEERIKNLTFAIIGAGPTGIEFASELRDFIEQDGPKYYPNLLKYVRIKVIEASSTVLAPFDKSLQEEAIQQLNRKTADTQISELISQDEPLTELLLESSVKEVDANTITLGDGTTIDYGVAVWAAGNGPLPITLQLVEDLGTDQQEQQSIARGRVAVDPWLRAIGSQGQVLCFGDCSVNPNAQLPATAQVAAQQGEYLASLMNNQYQLSPETMEDSIFPPPKRNPEVPLRLSDQVAGFAIQDWDYAKPFQFLNLGILAYTGRGTALAQVSLLPDTPNVQGKGQVGNALWRSVYLSKQVSLRNRLLVLNDWTKRQLFGRDITRL